MDFSILEILRCNEHLVLAGNPQDLLSMAAARGVDGVLCDSVVLLLAPDSLAVVDVSRQM